ncbi:MAG: vWA domain-containing protein [Acidimicrobiales bacterium]
MPQGSSAWSAADLAAFAAAFAGALRTAGSAVSVERAGRLATAVALAAPATVAELRPIACAVLVADPAQRAVFDQVFELVFGGAVDHGERRGDQQSALPAAAAPHSAPHPAGARRPGSGRPEARPPLPPLAGFAQGADGREGSKDAAADRPALLATASNAERLAQQDFALLDESELAELASLASQLALTAPTRRTRRRRRSAGSRGELDLRTTLRLACALGGEPVRLARRRRRRRPRRIVLLLDISGSMAPYARAYLMLLHLVAGGAPAEVFTFATRLTRLTPALKARRPDEALAHAGRLALDWSGGTRIGAALAQFNREWARPGLARGAVVVILSDGWEQGDPALLGGEMARLARVAHRIVWVNPRSAHEGWAPLAGGMAAAAPHCGAILAGNTAVELRAVLAAIAE